jgi:lipoprotein-anchoring transpeptidase ErfK/SrfK
MLAVMSGAGGRLLRSCPLLLAASTLVAPAAALGADSVPAGVQQLLVLDHRVVARASPGAGAQAVTAVAARTPLTSSPTVLPVVASALGPGGGRWLEVRLPTRPNGSTGWVPASSGTTGDTHWRIVVHRAARRAVVYEDAIPRARFPVIVGKRKTPTPLGTFFVVEKVHLGAAKQGAPWALATSAYSDVLQEFDGGPGQVALHGTTGLAGGLGTFASHGCIRFAPSAITWIAAHVDAGTPIVVSR